MAQLAAMKHYSLPQIMTFSFVLFTDWGVTAKSWTGDYHFGEVKKVSLRVLTSPISEPLLF